MVVESIQVEILTSQMDLGSGGQKRVPDPPIDQPTRFPFQPSTMKTTTRGPPPPTKGGANGGGGRRRRSSMSGSSDAVATAERHVRQPSKCGSCECTAVPTEDMYQFELDFNVYTSLISSRTTIDIVRDVGFHLNLTKLLGLKIGGSLNTQFQLTKNTQESLLQIDPTHGNISGLLPLQNFGRASIVDLSVYVRARW
jgi:hypothetical protein